VVVLIGIVVLLLVFVVALAVTVAPRTPDGLLRRPTRRAPQARAYTKPPSAPVSRIATRLSG